MVDDASAGGLISKAVRHFSGVQLLRFARRGGFCAAVNAGMAGAGEIVELLNDDTEVTPGWAERALRGFDDATVAAVAPLVLWATDPRT